ncbi:hypothetical protein QMT40_002183 [Parvibaculaceae bacterium PLY_AMNH_Bact1]|nr:hypothetical protein QMT40_002183 [Parvibaculaceae bacterium PLY_AMNH_Bact1]
MSTTSVEIQGATYHLGASAEDASVSDSAVAAGVAFLKQAVREAHDDMGLVSQGHLDVLPRSEAARTALEAARTALEAARTAVHAGHPDHSIAAAKYAVVGALADQVVQHMREAAHVTSVYVVSGECGTFSIDFDAVLDVPSDLRGALWLEMIRGLRPGVVKGGIAVAGRRVPNSADGDADIVAVYARSGAEAALSAILVADSAGLSDRAKNQAIPATEDIWDALSKGVRVLSPLRQANLVRTGVLALRGRGRCVGQIAQDRLLRFGVSDWR